MRSTLLLLVSTNLEQAEATKYQFVLERKKLNLLIWRLIIGIGIKKSKAWF